MFGFSGPLFGLGVFLDKRVFMSQIINHNTSAHSMGLVVLYHSDRLLFY